MHVELPQTLGHLVGPLKDVTVSAFSLIGQLVTVLALTFLLILHGRDYVDMALSLTGAREQRYRELIIEVNRAVAGYMLGNIAISALATLATWIVLSILGVPYALSLGFVVGFFDLIPLVGATIGAIVVALATVTVSFPLATIVWIAFIIVWQRFEDYVVQPFVYGRALHVNPIVTIVSVIAGAELLGILGALLAIPTAAAIQIVLRDWWSRRGYGQTRKGCPKASRPRTRSALIDRRTSAASGVSAGCARPTISGVCIGRCSVSLWAWRRTHVASEGVVNSRREPTAMADQPIIRENVVVVPVRAGQQCLRGADPAEGARLPGSAPSSRGGRRRPWRGRSRDRQGRNR